MATGHTLTLNECPLPSAERVPIGRRMRWRRRPETSACRQIGNVGCWWTVSTYTYIFLNRAMVCKSFNPFAVVGIIASCLTLQSALLRGCNTCLKQLFSRPRENISRGLNPKRSFFERVRAGRTRTARQHRTESPLGKFSEGKRRLDPRPVPRNSWLFFVALGSIEH